MLHKSPGIYLTAQENPRETSDNPFDEGCRTSQSLKWGTLPPNDIGWFVQQSPLSNVHAVRRHILIFS